MVLSLWRRDSNDMDSRWVNKVDIPESPISSDARDPGQQRRDSLHCHKDGVLGQQVSSFSPERWAKMVLQERAAEGSV